MIQPEIATARKVEPAHRPWRAVGLLFAAILVNYIDRGNLSIAAVPLMHDFGMSPVAMGTLLSAFFWTYTLLQIPAGYLVDRFGLKWTYAAAFLIWSLSSAAVGLASTFTQVLFLRLLLGVGEAAAQPASLAYIRRSFPADRQGLPTAVYISGMMLGPGLGAIIGALLIDRVGWRMLFVATGLGACVWLIPWLVLAPSTRAPRIPAAARANPLTWRVLLSRPTFWGITIGAFFYSYYWYFCLTWVPSYLVMTHKLTFLKMGTYTALPLLLTAVVGMASGRLADRVIARMGRPVGIRKRFVASGFLLGSSIAFAPLLHTPGGAITLLFVSLLGVGLAGANYWALTQAATPPAMIGRVIGYQNTIANGAGICAPVLTGFVVDRTHNFNLALVFAGTAMVIASSAFAFLVREQDAARFSGAAE